VQAFVPETQLNLLTIDTSTTTCSVSLTTGERLVSEALINLGKTHASQLLRMVDAALGDAGLTIMDLDGIGVALGPGSFTGLRVGLATVKGLAMAAEKPVYGFSSLAMLAMNLPWADHPVCPMFDAKKKEVYAALYICRDLPMPLIGDCVVSPDAFLERLDGDTIFVGEGALAYREKIIAQLGEMAHFAPSFSHLPRASAGAYLAREACMGGKAISPAELLPRYLRASEAELARINRAAI
jgi:tRNA threonylcarbamoyladenosine biosynthesis protein TsaB